MTSSMTHDLKDDLHDSTVESSVGALNQPVGDMDRRKCGGDLKRS